MSEDLRVIKTRSNIRKEFLSLLQQYEFRAITVSMIIERCQINRSTFYRNYEDKYALTDAIVQDLLEEFSRNMETAFIRESKAEPGSFNSMLEYFSAAPERTDPALPACPACQYIRPDADPLQRGTAERDLPDFPEFRSSTETVPVLFTDYRLQYSHFHPVVASGKP